MGHAKGGLQSLYFLEDLNSIDYLSVLTKGDGTHPMTEKESSWVISHLQNLSKIKEECNFKLDLV